MRIRILVAAAISLALPAGAWDAAPPELQQLLYSPEGNRLRRYDVDTFDAGPLREDVLIESAELDPGGRDVNGSICPLPDGSGRFVAGEDTGQPHPPAGWGVFEADGSQVGKLTATYFTDGPEPFGCAFTPDGLLFTTEVGNQAFGPFNGQLILWFPPYQGFPGPPGAYPASDAPSTNFCKIATSIGTASGVATDELGRVYVASPRQGAVLRFSPPFPTGPDAAGGCGRTDALGSPLADADRVNREVFLRSAAQAGTPTGLARAPGGNWYVASVLTGQIAEFDPDGAFVRMIVQPRPDETVLELPLSTGHPQSVVVDARGVLYYADLDLVGSLFVAEPGPDGKVRRVVFDAAGNPGPPEVLRGGLAFPDGLGLLPGNFEPGEWRGYAGGPRRLFFNPNESIVSAANVGQLAERWRFLTGAIVTGSPAVARVTLPREGEIQVVFFQSWDHYLYAVRLSDGSLLWRRLLEDQPGASFPNVASVDVSRVDGRDVLFVAAGEVLYALDPASGRRIWDFTAGTGCQRKGVCGFEGERNEIESSALVVGDRVLVGMDVNDEETGKGGFFAVDARDGRLLWWFDLETGATCRPRPQDRIQRFDGYHSEAELRLPRGFLATRPGCSFDRTPTGCGNVWSSASYDAARGLAFFSSSNCDTDHDPATPVPPPPMPPYDEALVALDLDGTPVWRWRPREVDNDDLAFGASPQLFSIDVAGARREVLGIGNKDGTYTVLDRDGVNEVTGARWDDADPSGLPYWRTQVVPGGEIGGILATPAVDEERRLIYFTTAPGFDPLRPQRPTMHALDMDTGAVVWNNRGTRGFLSDASFGPTSAIPGVAFTGTVIAPFLRAYDTDSGALRLVANVGQQLLLSAVASGAVVVDGTVLVGTGIGTRTSTGSGPSDLTAIIPSVVMALCVPGTSGCAACNDGEDNDADGRVDAAADPDCAGPGDDSEEPVCQHGMGQPGDELPDAFDPACSPPARN